MGKGITEIVLNNKGTIRFLLDSGAFTAWKKGKEVKLDDYCRFIESLPFTPWRYFSLDVVGNPKKTLENYNTMLERGFNPVPIFTRGEDLSAIDEYYESSDIVGVGGLVGTKGNKGFVKGIMKKVGARKVHWLGFTSLPFINYYKPYMCDSSSWETGARYGSFNLYVGNGRTVTVSRKAFAKEPSALIKTTLKNYGFNPYDLAKEKNWRGGRSVNRNVNGASAVRLSLDIENKLGTRLFLAATTSLAVNILKEQFAKIRI